MLNRFLSYSPRLQLFAYSILSILLGFSAHRVNSDLQYDRLLFENSPRNPLEIIRALGFVCVEDRHDVDERDLSFNVTDDVVGSLWIRKDRRAVLYFGGSQQPLLYLDPECREGRRKASWERLGTGWHAWFELIEKSGERYPKCAAKQLQRKPRREAKSKDAYDSREIRF